MAIVDFATLPPYSPKWMPGLAEDLAAAFWAENGQGFHPTVYGSWRWLTGDSKAERIDLATLSLRGSDTRIEKLGADARDRYAKLGLRMRERDCQHTDIELLQRGFSALKIGGLLTTVGALVRSIHLLEADDGFDVSHSDPELPFSIFVSLPIDEQQADMRLAESILHEAMHLQLTLIEQHQPLASLNTAKAFSPWQNRERPITGLLHGLYVFRIIDQWLHQLSQKEILDSDAQAYISRRRTDIAAETELVAGIRSSTVLTQFGRELVDYLLSDSCPVHEI